MRKVFSSIEALSGKELWCLLLVNVIVKSVLCKSPKVVAANRGDEFRYYNVGVLMASQLDSPFDLERCGPAVDLALDEINEKYLAHHRVKLKKVQAR